MNFLGKIKLIFEQPGILFRYRSLRIRKIYYIFSKYLHLGTLFSRKKKLIIRAIYILKDMKKLKLIR